ncbi:MAG: hypothetical protein M1834_002107 [Cirrosporium novae-zelandiae]|nr:MAG: hypothetical protein M1834_002107 [Cirrosporium novae-zelandiae]
MATTTTTADADADAAAGSLKHDGQPDPEFPSSQTSISSKTDATSSPLRSTWQRLFNILTWMPPRCRYDPARPHEFSMGLNLLFGFAGTFTVANLYYNHPILNILAEDFHVSYEQASVIPTVMQGGYAAGLLFICPLGDLFRIRFMVLALIFICATVWIGLCATSSFSVFTALSFICAATTVTPQLMVPLAGALAPPHRRASAISIVMAGLMLGLLIARILSGIVTQYTNWRNIYWLALGLQYLICILLYLFLPDYPSKNPDLNYLHALWTIIQMFYKYPLLVQACLISLCTSTTFTNFWTTLTALLSSPPYNYSSVIIGLFALIGIGALFTSPLCARLVIDNFVPLFSVICGLFITLAGVLIGTFAGKHTVAGPILQAFLLDLGIQATQIANRSSLYSIPQLHSSQNRANTAFMVCVFAGQLVGTAVGNHVYARGGWVNSGSVSIGFLGAGLLLAAVRGPWETETRWVGWRGGWNIRRRRDGNANANTDDDVDVDVDTNLNISINTSNNNDQDPDIEKAVPHHHHLTNSCIENESPTTTTPEEKEKEMEEGEITTVAGAGDVIEEKAKIG